MVNVLVAYSFSLFKTYVPSLINDVLVRVGSIILFSVYFIKWLTLTQFVVLFVAIYGAQAMALLVYLSRRDNLSISINRAFLKAQGVSVMFKYGLLMSAASLSSIGLKYVDAVMLGMYKPKEAGLNALDIIGIYSIATFIATIVEAPLNALEKITVPQIANSWAENDIKNISDIYSKSSKYLFLLGGILFIIVNLNLSSLFALMPDNDFALGSSVVLVMSFGTLLNMATGANDSVLFSSSKYTYLTYLLIGLFFVAIINYLIFIPVFGMVGAALATAFSAFLYNISKFLLIWKFFKLQPFTMVTVKIAAVIVSTFVLCSFIPAIQNPILNIFIRSISIVALYGGLTLVLNIVPELVAQVKRKF